MQGEKKKMADLSSVYARPKSRDALARVYIYSPFDIHAGLVGWSGARGMLRSRNHIVGFFEPRKNLPLQQILLFFFEDKLHSFVYFIKSLYTPDVL